MFAQGGARIFFVGTAATVCRDVVFGGVYASMRHQKVWRGKASGSVEKYGKTKRFLVNAVSAGVATIISSPWNFVRNMHYSRPPGSHHTAAVVVLARLFHRTVRIQGSWRRLAYLQQRLCIGFGTLRVAVGMAFSDALYSYCSRNILGS